MYYRIGRIVLFVVCVVVIKLVVGRLVVGCSVLNIVVFCVRGGKLLLWVKVVLLVWLLVKVLVLCWKLVMMICILVDFYGRLEVLEILIGCWGCVD